MSDLDRGPARHRVAIETQEPVPSEGVGDPPRSPIVSFRADGGGPRAPRSLQLRRRLLTRAHEGEDRLVSPSTCCSTPEGSCVTPLESACHFH